MGLLLAKRQAEIGGEADPGASPG